MNKTKIGELNGAWGILFKISQLLIPITAIIILPFCLWIATSFAEMHTRLIKLELFANAGPRFTKENADSLRITILADTEQIVKTDNQRIMDRIDLLTAEIVSMKIEFARHTAQSPKP